MRCAREFSQGTMAGMQDVPWLRHGMASGVTVRRGRWLLMGPYLWTAGVLTRMPYNGMGCGAGGGALISSATQRLEPVIERVVEV